MRNRVAPPFRGWKSVGGGKSGDGKNDRCWVWWEGGGRKEEKCGGEGLGRKEEKGFFLVGGEGGGGNTGNTGADVGNTEDSGKHRKEGLKE